MKQRATLFQRATGIAAVLWAAASLALVVYGQLTGPARAEPPILTTSLGGLVIVSALGPDAEALGVRRGQRVLAVDGVPVQTWYRERGWESVRAGRPMQYRLEQSGGRIAEVRLLPKPAGSAYQRFFVPVFAALTAAGLVYLLVGVFVWRLRCHTHRGFSAWKKCRATQAAVRRRWHSQRSYCSLCCPAVSCG